MKYSILCLLLILHQPLISQERAITEGGDTVYLYSNGMWSYEIEEAPGTQMELSYLDMDIPVDSMETALFTPPGSTKELRNKNDQFTIKYDPSKWKRVPAASFNEDAEFALESKITDIWCVIISEEIEFEPLALYKVALQNIKDFSGESPVLKKTERLRVNGAELIHGVYSIGFSGVNLLFDTYYYSDERGSVF